MVDLDRIEQAALAATPGPWIQWDDGDVGTGYPVSRAVSRRRNGGEPEVVTVESGHIANAYGPDGAYMVAVAPDVILELIGELREARAALADRD